MKKFILLALCAFFLVGCTQSSLDRNPTNDSNITDDDSQDVAAPGDMGDEATEEVIDPIDWNQAYEEAEEYFTEEIDDGVNASAFELSVDENSQTMDILIVLADDTDPNAALEYAGTVLRQLNDAILFTQDNELELSSDRSYGGIYDEYSLSLGVTDETNAENPDGWFVREEIPAGEYRELTLQEPQR